MYGHFFGLPVLCFLAFTKTGQKQRKLAWPQCMDDTHKPRERQHISFCCPRRFLQDRPGNKGHREIEHVGLDGHGRRRRALRRRKPQLAEHRHRCHGRRARRRVQDQRHRQRLRARARPAASRAQQRRRSRQRNAREDRAAQARRGPTHRPRVR